MDIERTILSAVAWADIILTAILPWLIPLAWIIIAAFALGLIQLISKMTRRKRKRRRAKER